MGTRAPAPTATLPGARTKRVYDVAGNMRVDGVARNMRIDDVAGYICQALPWLDCAPAPDTPTCRGQCVVAEVEIEAKFESASSHYSFQRSDPGAVNVGLIGSTCTALPRRCTIRGISEAPNIIAGRSAWTFTRPLSSSTYATFVR